MDFPHILAGICTRLALRYGCNQRWARTSHRCRDHSCKTHKDLQYAVEDICRWQLSHCFHRWPSVRRGWSCMDRICSLSKDPLYIQTYIYSLPRLHLPCSQHWFHRDLSSRALGGKKRTDLQCNLVDICKQLLFQMLNTRHSLRRDSADMGSSRIWRMDLPRIQTCTCRQPWLH